MEKSGKEILEKMEHSFSGVELGFALLKVSQKLYADDHDPEKVIYLAKRALDIFIDCERSGIILQSPVGCVSAVICALSVLGSSCYKLKKYDESLKYLEWADRNLKKLEEDSGGCDSVEFLHSSIHAIQFLLSKVKRAMGRLEEWVLHLRNVLEVKEKEGGTEEGSLAIGKACMDVCDAYVMTMNEHEALPFALKALGIYMKLKGSDSVEVARARRSLGEIYSSLGQSENDMGHIEEALEQSRLASNFFNSVGCSYETLASEIARADKLNQLGRYEESIGVLKAVVSSDKAEGALLTGAWLSMASAYCFQEKFEEARDLLETAKKTLEVGEIEPLRMAVALGDMSVLYEEMNDIDNAIALLRRSLALPNLHEKLIIEYSKRLFVLISESGMREQAIQYLEEAVERLKQSLGPKHSVTTRI